MILGEKTLSVLKNYAQINPSLHVKEGTTIKTISPSKTVLAVYEAEEEFPVEFAIYELPKFLSCVSMLNNPELTFTENSIEMRKGNQQLVFKTCKPGLIISAANVNVRDINPIVEFELSKEQFVAVKKAAITLRLNTIVISGDGEKLFVSTKSSDNSSADQFRIEIGETDNTFHADVSLDNIKMVDDNYQVKLEKSFVEFSGAVRYFMGLEASSEF